MYDNPIDNILKNLTNEVDPTLKKRFIMRQKSQKNNLDEREENRLINSIIQAEISLPDDVLVADLFNDYKIIEFTTALFALICKIVPVNLAIFSGICWYETKVGRWLRPQQYNTYGVDNGIIATLIILDISTLFFSKLKF
jgi:hypothetical protein